MKTSRIGISASPTAWRTTRGVEAARAVCEEAGQREDEEELAELGGLELERPEVDPPLRAARLLREQEDEDHQDDRAPVDRALGATVAIGIDRERDEQRHDAHADRDRLAEHEVALVPLDVVAGDPRDRPEAVGDEGADGSDEQPVEPAHVGEDVDALLRSGTGGGDVQHQPVLVL